MLTPNQFKKKVVRRIHLYQQRYLERACARYMTMDEITAADRRRLLRIYSIATFTFQEKRKEKKQRNRESRLAVIEANLSPDEAANRERVKEVYDDIMFCNILYGSNSQDYFSFQFERLAHKGRRLYITNRNRHDFYKGFNNQNYKRYLDMKPESYRRFKPFYGRDLVIFYDEEDRADFIKFVSKHPTFIYKPMQSSGGHGVIMIDAEKFTSADDLFDILMSTGTGVAEELIIQREELAHFHPASVNSVRLVSFLNENNDIEILWTFLRIGMGGGITDNTSGGGMGAMIDPETGIIKAPGRGIDGKQYVFHPDTGAQIVGFQMPEWDKAVAMARDMARLIPEMKVIGWDLAYSERGWVIVEGNSHPQCMAPQVTELPGKKHLYEKVLNYVNESKE